MRILTLLALFLAILAIIFALVGIGGNAALWLSGVAIILLAIGVITGK